MLPTKPSALPSRLPPKAFVVQAKPATPKPANSPMVQAFPAPNTVQRKAAPWPPVYAPAASPQSSAPKPLALNESPTVQRVSAPAPRKALVFTASGLLPSLQRSVAQPLMHAGFASSVIQRVCNCGKKSRSSNTHKNTCPEHPNNKKKKAEKVKEVHVQNQSYTNLLGYDGEWARAHNVTEKQVKAFTKTKQKIHGHLSGDPSKGRHDNTTKDIENFHSWFGKTYPDQ